MQRRELLLSGTAAGIAAVSARVFAQTAASGDKLIAWTDLPPPVPWFIRGWTATMSSRAVSCQMP
jgi:hypothetical protein